MHKYKRNLFLLDKNFQLKFSTFVVLMFLLPSLIYPIFIFVLYHFLIKKIESVEIAAALADKELTLILILISMHLFLCGIIFIVCIFQTHKIAGPIFKVKKWLTHLANDEKIEGIYLRKGDYFPELLDYIKKVADKP